MCAGERKFGRLMPGHVKVRRPKQSGAVLARIAVIGRARSGLLRDLRDQSNYCLLRHSDENGDER